MADMRCRCPICQMELWPERCGIAFSKLKTDIIALVLRSGQEGIPSQSLFNILFAGREGNFGDRLTSNTLKAHINQINTKLAPTTWRIRSSRAGQQAKQATYRLIHEKCYRA